MARARGGGEGGGERGGAGSAGARGWRGRQRAGPRPGVGSPHLREAKVLPGAAGSGDASPPARARHLSLVAINWLGFNIDPCILCARPSATRWGTLVMREVDNL